MNARSGGGIAPPESDTGMFARTAPIKPHKTGTTAANKEENDMASGPARFTGWFRHPAVRPRVVRDWAAADPWLKAVARPPLPPAGVRISPKAVHWWCPPP